MGVQSHMDSTLVVSTPSMDTWTAGQYEDAAVTVILLEAGGRKLIWLPHVLLTVLMLTLLALSFVNFHRKYKDRYDKRVLMARREKPAAGASDDARVSPFLNAIYRNAFSNAENDEAEAGRGTPSPNGGPRGATFVEMKDRAFTKKKSKDKGLSTVVPMDLEHVESTPVIPVNFTPQQLHVDCQAMNSKLNDRQCLTFQKRDSRLNMFPNSQGPSDGPKWVPIRGDTWRINRQTSRSQLTESPPQARSAGSIFSYMGSRVKDNSSRRISVNMWASGATRRGLGGNREESKPTLKMGRARSGIFHL